MRPKVGDRIIVEPKRVAQSSRVGVIAEVIRESPPRVRVRWEDGHESVLTPRDGTAAVETDAAK